jgi:hypothetical protein
MSIFIVTSPVDQAGYDHAADKETNQGDETADSQLERTAQPVAARSAVGHAGAEHGHHPAGESHPGALDGAPGAEPGGPHVGTGLHLNDPEVSAEIMAPRKIPPRTSIASRCGARP